MSNEFFILFYFFIYTTNPKTKSMRHSTYMKAILSASASIAAASPSAQQWAERSIYVCFLWYASFGKQY